VVQVLAAPVVMVAISSLATRVLTALDRPSTVLRFSIGSLVANLLGIAVGVQWGIVGVAAGIAVVSVPTGLTVIYLACRELGISVGRFLRPQVMIFAASTGMVVLVRVVDLALGSRLSPAPTLAVEVSVGVVSYVGLLALASPQVLRDLYDLRKRRTRRDTASSLAA
jgi:PST family polysaccharide transporter